MNTCQLKSRLIRGIGLAFILALLTLPFFRNHAIYILKQPVSGWLLPFYF